MRKILKTIGKGLAALIVAVLAFLAFMGIARAGDMSAASTCTEATVSWHLPPGDVWKQIEDEGKLVADLYHPDGTVERGIPVNGTRPATPGATYRVVWRDPTAVDWSGEWGDASIVVPGLAVCPSPVVPPPPADTPPPAPPVEVPPVVVPPPAAPPVAPPVVVNPPVVVTECVENCVNLPATGRTGNIIMLSIATFLSFLGYALYRVGRPVGWVSPQMRFYIRFVRPRVIWLNAHLVLSFRRSNLWMMIFTPPEMYQPQPAWVYSYRLAS
jgi:hypothetical protein